MFVCSECGATQPVAGHCPNDGTQLTPIAEDVLLGTTIGAYRVARLLGIGGMGRVYKGVHPQIGSRVAIKVLSRECSDRRDLVERFFSEAKAVNLIRHESIVNVLDLAMLPDGRPFIIMEYLDGSPLAACIETAIAHQQPLALGGLARLSAEVLDALGAAHAKGIVHRDLKPDNIFVAPSGRPKVLDFGIAKLLPELGGSSTQTGSLLGTPHYMSPEQAAGKPVDSRADLYAMGVILFECATGTKPFLADSLFELLRKHIDEPPPSVRAMRPDLPVELEHVIHTALAKQPDHRFATAAAMSAALQHATQGLSPDQWAPIIASGSHPRPLSSGVNWNGTPASWANRPTAPNRPSDLKSPQMHQSTVSSSSGQVAVHNKKTASSSKGLLFAMLAIFLLGGGITAAVLVTHGGASDSEDEPVSVTEVTRDVTPTKPDPKPNKPTKPTTPDSPTTTADSTETSDTDSDDSKPLDQDSEKAISDALKAIPSGQRKMVEQQLRELIKDLPADQRKLVLGQLKDLSKMSNLGPAITNAVGGGGGGGGGGSTGGSTGGATPSGDLVDRRMIQPPSFTPNKIDVTAFVTWAIKTGTHDVADAELVRIDVDGVYPDGHADLTLASLASPHGSIDVRMFSPSHARRDPKVPRGVKQELKCMFRIIGEPDSVEIRDLTSECKEMVLHAPRCTAAQVWGKALAKRADLGSNAVAELGYRADFGGKARWYFDIRDEKVSWIFPDDC